MLDSEVKRLWRAQLEQPRWAALQALFQRLYVLELTHTSAVLILRRVHQVALSHGRQARAWVAKECEVERCHRRRRVLAQYTQKRR